MEDKGINVILKKGKIIFVIITIILIATVVGLIFRNQLMINKNTNNLTQYLSNNGFKESSDGIYKKTTSNNTQTIDYVYTKSTSSISKDITETNTNGNMFMSLNYTSKAIIEATLQQDGLNNNEKYGSLLQTATFNTKNSNFNCKVLTNDNFDSKCSELKKEIINFEREINTWLNKSNVEIKYIK